MKPSQTTAIPWAILAAFFLVGTSLAGISQILVPTFTSSSKALLPASTQQEVHLVRSLFAETNRSFDEALWKSLRADIKSPAIISFHLVSFVFSYPTTNDVPSYCEMAQPDDLVCVAESVTRRSGSTNEIPLNYVRLVDSQKKEVTAELDLLVGAAPLNDHAVRRYFRRSFRFVYRDGWTQLGTAIQEATRKGSPQSETNER